jgi:riboflavin kinase/FMN adenylyltransferase
MTGKVVPVKRWLSLKDVPDDIGPSVVTIGNFDGVHRGHQAVLARLTARAAAVGGVSVVITFDPHPLAVLAPERAPVPVSSIDQRCVALAELGVDAVLVLAFTKEFAAWSPERFVRDVLVDSLHARVVVVGEDTRFGHRNSGDVNTLRELGTGFGFEVDALSDLGATAGLPSPGERRWSSSWVRELLSTGQVDQAAGVLGRYHRVTGTVVHGDHRGRELGYPTANLSQGSEGVIPADGVYAGWLVRVNRAESDPERCLPAAISVGTNPTFDGTQRRVEAYALDRTDLDLYGEPIGVDFVTLLRPTLRFDGIEALVKQMHEDVERCREVLIGATWPDSTAIR